MKEIFGLDGGERKRDGEPGARGGGKCRGGGIGRFAAGHIDRKDAVGREQSSGGAAEEGGGFVAVGQSAELEGVDAQFA